MHAKKAHNMLHYQPELIGTQRDFQLFEPGYHLCRFLPELNTHPMVIINLGLLYHSMLLDQFKDDSEFMVELSYNFIEYCIDQLTAKSLQLLPHYRIGRGSSVDNFQASGL